MHGDTITFQEPRKRMKKPEKKGFIIFCRGSGSDSGVITGAIRGLFAISRETWDKLIDVCTWSIFCRDYPKWADTASATQFLFLGDCIRK